MRTVILLFAVGFVVMGVTIAYGLVVGDLFDEAPALLEFPWFHVSMIDLYTGFLLFSGWIVARERSPLRAAIWIVLVMTLGNLASCAYAITAGVRSGGDWRVFWMGATARSDR